MIPMQVSGSDPGPAKKGLLGRVCAQTPTQPSRKDNDLDDWSQRDAGEQRLHMLFFSFL